MILTRKQMDRFKCADLFCKDPSHDLVLHSKCHIDFPSQVFITDEILELQCAECGKLIFYVAIEFGCGEDNFIMHRVKCQDENCEKKHYFIIPKCHETYIWASYHKKTGVLELKCADCDKSVYKISVKTE
jgi:hypothetical protein